MENFVFSNTTRIIFGRGTENQVGEELKGYKKVLLHYGSGSIKQSGLYERVIQSLDAAGVEWVELGGAKPNPSLSLVYEGIRLCRLNQVDMILAVGGRQRHRLGQGHRHGRVLRRRRVGLLRPGRQAPAGPAGGGHPDHRRRRQRIRASARSSPARMAS